MTPQRPRTYCYCIATSIFGLQCLHMAWHCHGRAAQWYGLWRVGGKPQLAPRGQLHPLILRRVSMIPVPRLLDDFLELGSRKSPYLSIGVSLPLDLVGLPTDLNKEDDGKSAMVVLGGLGLHLLHSTFTNVPY